jgi:hypothetical protein
MFSYPATPATTISRATRNVYLIPPRILAPSHRHAAPSGPWPYDDEGELESAPASPTAPLGTCGHTDDCADCKQWISYPQSLFPNWSLRQVQKSGLESAILDKRPDLTCVIRKIDVLKSGEFEGSNASVVDEYNKRTFWHTVQKQVRTRACQVI